MTSETLASAQHERMRALIVNLWPMAIPVIRKKEAGFICNRIARALRKTKRDIEEVALSATPFPPQHWQYRSYYELTVKCRRTVYVRYTC